MSDGASVVVIFVRKGNTMRNAGIVPQEFDNIPCASSQGFGRSVPSAVGRHVGNNRRGQQPVHLDELVLDGTLAVPCEMMLSCTDLKLKQ